MQRVLRVLLLFLVTPRVQASTEFLKAPQWPTYVKIIHVYHRSFPGVYPALELLPLDKLPPSSFGKEIQATAQAWNETQRQKKGHLGDRQKEIQVSRAANERLLSLVREHLNELVTLKSVIDTIPADQRVALSPLDPIFWNSVVGLKAKEDLKKLKSDPSLIERVSIRPEKGILDFQLEGGQYRLRILGKGNDRLRVKGSFQPSGESRSLSQAPLEKDAELMIHELVGPFFQKKADKMPFGPYPSPKEQFLGEEGMHYKGDGHLHFF